MGLVPSWAKEPKTSFSTINARAETITQKPAFRKLLSGKRCLVPATGYFEWPTSNGAGEKQPYRLQVTGGQIMAMAGQDDVWKGQYNGPLVTYRIITTEARPGIRALHEILLRGRIPLVLARERSRDFWQRIERMCYKRYVQLTAKVTLQPTPEQVNSLRETLERTNEAANFVSERPWQRSSGTHKGWVSRMSNVSKIAQLF